VDIACLPGEPVRATLDGFGSARFDYNMGWVFTLRGLTEDHSYSHLATVVPAGDYKLGDVVGTCGSTGRLSAGPHVHWSIQLRK